MSLTVSITVGYHNLVARATTRWRDDDDRRLVGMNHYSNWRVVWCFIAWLLFMASGLVVIPLSVMGTVHRYFPGDSRRPSYYWTGRDVDRRIATR